MTELIIAIIALTCIGIVSLMSAGIIKRQNDTITDLTNRVMVLSGHRDYAQTADGIFDRAITDKRLRKPMSWHDDPNIEEEIDETQ